MSQMSQVSNPMYSVIEDSRAYLDQSKQTLHRGAWAGNPDTIMYLGLFEMPWFLTQGILESIF